MTSDPTDTWLTYKEERDEARREADKQGRYVAALREAVELVVDLPIALITPLRMRNLRQVFADTADVAAQWVRIPTLEAIARGIYANEAGSMKLDDDAFDDLEEADKLLYFIRAKGAHNALLAAAPAAKGEAGEGTEPEDGG